MAQFSLVWELPDVGTDALSSCNSRTLGRIHKTCSFFANDDDDEDYDGQGQDNYGQDHHLQMVMVVTTLERVCTLQSGLFQRGCRQLALQLCPGFFQCEVQLK